MGIQGINASAIAAEVQGQNNQTKAVSGLLTKAKWLAGASILAASTAANAAPALIINNVGAPTVVGSGQGKRAIWTNGGTVGGQPVDIVAVITTATLNHNLSTTSSRPQVTSAGQDKMFVEWRLYQAGTYVIASGTGGVPVNADVHVQFNDVDGPANEEVYLPVCSGAIKWLRIDSTATTGRAFGTVSGQAETFSLIGDKNYNNEPVSGVEALYPDTSTFSMGHTGNNGFLVRLDNPSYTVSQTFDYQCADFTPPVAVDDSKEGVAGSPTIINILNNDAIATNNNNGPNNNSQLPSEFAMQSVSLVAPSGATGVTTDVKGRITGFGVPGEGTWAYNATTGALTFTPEPSFKGYATNIDYTFTNALGIASNTAKVTVWYPAIGVTKSSAFNDTNGDGYGQVGETIDYIYQVKSYGAEALQNIAVTETGFTGAGTLPVPTYDSGDANSDNKLDLTETWVYKASYALVAADLTAGNVANSATGIGQTAAGTTVSDTSDSSNPADGTGTSGPGPNNGDPTRTPLAKAPITATNDSQVGTIYAGAGSVNAYNVLGNDTLKTVTATPAAVTLSVVAPASDAGVTLDITTGQVSVALGTPAGTYTIDYKICETANPTNCATATATVVVTASAPIIAATDAPAPVDSIAGGSNVINALTNDKLNGVAVVIGDINLTITTPASNPGVTLDTATGNVSVAPGTPAGTYTIDYKICEKTNPTNCATSTVTVVVRSVLAASDDSGAPVNGIAGNPSAFNAFANDTINGNPVVAGDLNTTITAPATPLAPGKPVPVLDPATGNVAVPAGTPAGDYTIGYQICEKADPTNCKTATITVKVVAAPIAATNDIAGPVTSLSGGANLVDAFANDRLNGVAIVPGTVTATITAPASNPGVTLDPATGQVSVTPGTPAGNYTIDYKICENLNPTNCANAQISVTVQASPIAASNDSPAAVSGLSGAPSIINAFANDTLGGVAIDPAKITASVTTPASNPGIALDPATGLVSVAANTPAGTYTIAYRICETANPTNCADASVTVIVTAATIAATNDTTPTVTTTTGGSNLVNALANDTLNGVAVVLANINLRVTSPASNPGVMLDPTTGQVSVAPGTPAGNYSIGYEVCERLNPTNCATATVAVVVAATPLAATNDAPAPINGLTGNPNAINAFANDSLNGAPVDPAQINTTILTPASNPGVVLDPATGNVSVAANTPAGTYIIEYQICEKLNPTNCKTATVTIVVTAAPITAAVDAPSPVNGTAGGNDIINALANDTLNGAPVNIANITLTVTTPASNPGVVLDPATGLVDVAAGTPAGTYTIAYQICERLNPTNCATSTVTIVVTAAPIAATPDTPPAVNGTIGNPAVVNAFANDTLNGAPVDPAQITATVTTPASNPGVVLDPATGNVSVAAGTPAGSYTITYQICERLNPTNCATSTVTVVVAAAPIAATIDTTPPVGGIAGGRDLVNVLANDTLNGQPVALANIVLTVTSPAANSGVTLDPATGLVSVAPGTPAGTYSIGYQICELLNPTNCATATVAVVVNAAPITASVDAPPAVSGATGNPNVGNAFANDTLNGAPVNPANVTATVTTPASNPGVALNPATGIVSVAPGTPAGTYTIGYQICETLNPTNCATSTVTVIVQPPVIAAANDTPPPVRSGIANPNVINAFANDTLNGQPVNPALITASVITPAANPGVVLDPATGNVSVAANVPAGTYTITYQICETLNPTNCQTASVTVVVDPPISAVTGTVYTDGNGNDRLDSGEARRPGWIVEIVKDGVVVGRTLTDVNGEYRIEGLAPGTGYTIMFRNPENNVVYDRITGLTLGANTTVVDQNQPIDPSGVIYDSITRAPISGVTVQLTGVNGTPLPTACFVDASQASQTTGASGGYRFDIVPGAAPECPAGETVYRIAISPPAGYAPNSALLLPQTGPLDPSGLGNPVRVSPDATPPTIAAPTYYLDFRLAAGDPDIVNNHIAIDRLRNLTPLIVTKTSIKRSASVGDVVPYEITVRNAENLVRNNVDVVDILPAGMKYVMGTASVNGTPQEPVKTDRQVAWKGQVIPANGSVRYNLTLVVGAGVTGGEKVNTGLAQNGADGSPISNRGTAVVSITPNAVFDCSELLGKVFEDANRNGYQDANEPGVPGVRLATVNGQLITTDEYGRYHIACAAVPDARIGSNFVLKVDTRTLPLGWDTTTDNPRSIRLTRGKFGELNFGVAPKEDSSTSPGDLSKNRNEKGE